MLVLTPEDHSAYRKAVETTVLARLAAHTQTSRQLLSQVDPPTNKTQQDLHFGLVTDSLVAEHLAQCGHVLTLSVFETEAGLGRVQNQDRAPFSKSELHGLFQLHVGDKSALQQVVRSKLSQEPRYYRSLGTQTARDLDQTADTIDRKLQAVEREYLDRAKAQLAQQGQRIAPKIEAIRESLKRELEADNESRLRLFRETELKRALEKQELVYEHKLREIEQLAADQLRSKLKTLRSLEANILEEGEAKLKQLSTLKVTMERRILGEMQDLDREKLTHIEQKQRDFDRIRNLDINIDARERDVVSKEVFVESRAKNAQEGVSHLRQGLKHAADAQINLSRKQEVLMDELSHKVEDYKTRLDAREKEQQLLHSELKKKSFEADDRAEKCRKVAEENEHLRLSLSMQIELGRKKELTLQVHERRLEELQMENIRLKEAMNELKQAWLQAPRAADQSSRPSKQPAMHPDEYLSGRFAPII